MLSAGLAFLFKQVLLLVSYVKNNAFPQPLSAQEEQECLARMAQGDQDARNKLIEHNLRLVAHIVKKFNNASEETDDLISIGTIGLIKAVENYSPGRGTKLATFAARCVENEILMYFRTLKKTRKDVSLNDPIGQDKEGNAISLIDILKSGNKDIVDEIALKMDTGKIRSALDVLDDREKEVIIDRYGLGSRNDLTQREIAEKLDISRSYVSRIEKRALMKLYHEIYRKAGR
ncbi:RNA polymerase sporulation sigma factor SigK [Sporolactobacillus vineae]|uniref:RNA polymerase sporulation sigma factor SigK n=1 Tax=Sporolactobacillus vineae TaxID=444463 RepID=UPI0002893219|nr:RNA polymerase sporulation sigma factor SigK [Sporolactobacillus vineae]